MKIKIYQFNSRSFVSIVDHYECPVDPYVSCYLNGPISAKSPNTRVKYANDLLCVLRYFLRAEIILSNRISSGQLISLKEYMQFYEHCLYKKVNVDVEKNFELASFGDKRLRNIISANRSIERKVCNETAQGRIRRLRKYLTWMFEQFHDLHSVDRDVKDRFHKLISKIKLDEEDLGRNKSRSVQDPTESIIPDKVFYRLVSLISPTSVDNPFKRSKIRNYLIVALLIQTGIRRGALAKLKISDFHFYGAYNNISIYRSDNDPADSRLNKPNQKTRSHFATIAPSLMADVKFYIDHVRQNYPKASCHDFVFVSENDSKDTAGLPLSLGSINAIFRKLTTALGFHMHPHILRHKWNEMFSKVIGEKGIDGALGEAARNYMMGWSSRSTQAERYNDKQIALNARELFKYHQEMMDQQQ